MIKASKMNSFIFLIFFILGPLLFSFSFADETVYFNIKWSITCEGGGHAGASKYNLFDAFGFPMFGSMSSSSYYLSGGSTVPTDIKELAREIFKPEKFNLKQNYPNPFNPTTNIQFELPEAAHVELVIFNLLGQRLKTLVSNNFQAGYHHFIWDGTNDNGKQVGSGTYLFVIRATSDNKALYQDYKKMSLLK